MKRTGLSIIALFALLISLSIPPGMTSSDNFQGPQGPALQDHPGRKLRSLSLTKTSVISVPRLTPRRSLAR